MFFRRLVGLSEGSEVGDRYIILASRSFPMFLEGLSFWDT